MPYPLLYLEHAKQKNNTCLHTPINAHLLLVFALRVHAQVQHPHTA